MTYLAAQVKGLDRVQTIGVCLPCQLNHSSVQRFLDGRHSHHDHVFLFVW